jgi:NAD(P)-dependent dehydrogenase (short-subunit alcohol dehydrogenase family)
MGLLDGKVALVTGAGAGLGRAVALCLAAEGARVFAISIVRAELDELAALAAESSLTVATIEADVGDEADTSRVAGIVLGEDDRLDLLVNNAGVIAVKPIEETEPAEWDRILRTNLRGPYLYCRAFVPAMTRRREGTIINVTSMSSQGVRRRGRLLPVEVRPRGVDADARARPSPGTSGCAASTRVSRCTPMSMLTYDEEAKRGWVDPAAIAPGFARLAATADQRISGRRFDVWQVAHEGVAERTHREQPPPPEGEHGVSRFGFVRGRTVQAIPVILGVTIVSFFLLHLVPGDPARQILGQHYTLKAAAEIHHKLGLDQPLWTQYKLFMERLVHGNLGDSLYYHAPVADLIRQRLPVTLWLAFYATLIAIVISVPLATLSALHQNGVVDQSVRATFLLAFAMPPFWVGLVLILLLSLQVHAFPVAGYGSGFFDHLYNLFCRR